MYVLTEFLTMKLKKQTYSIFHPSSSLLSSFESKHKETTLKYYNRYNNILIIIYNKKPLFHLWLEREM